MRGKEIGESESSAGGTIREYVSLPDLCFPFNSNIGLTFPAVFLARTDIAREWSIIFFFIIFHWNINSRV